MWFAARGKGQIKTEDGSMVEYNSTARVNNYYTFVVLMYLIKFLSRSSYSVLTLQVLLVGMGADEQLVGYSRHRVKFKLVGFFYSV